IEEMSYGESSGTHVGSFSCAHHSHLNRSKCSLLETPSSSPVLHRQPHLQPCNFGPEVVAPQRL
ncbi:hypothetical protein H8958_021498, partial [Nasalis larvatus]